MLNIFYLFNYDSKGVLGPWMETWSTRNTGYFGTVLKENGRKLEIVRKGLYFVYAQVLIFTFLLFIYRRFLKDLFARGCWLRCLAGRMAMHACQIGPIDTAPPCPGSLLRACVGTKGGTLWGRQPFCPHEVVGLVMKLSSWLLQNGTILNQRGNFWHRNFNNSTV